MSIHDGLEASPTAPPSGDESSRMAVSAVGAVATGRLDPVGTAPTGLTEAEALARHERGEGNAVAFAPSRSYRRILLDNAFMSINVIIFAIGIALTVMGLFGDALVTVGLVLLNVAIAVVQETRAKRALDRIALLTRPQATVVRDGIERRIDPADIVRGDVLVAYPGDQVMVDGRAVGDGRAEVDESLLTGEADPVTRQVGDGVSSGSFVVTGRLYYYAERVGIASLANQLTARARAFRPVKTPVQQEVELVLRLMVVLILVLGGPIVLDLAIRLLGALASTVDGALAAPLARAYQGYSVQESVRAAAVVVSLIPQGLALMLTVSYAMGALRLAGRGVLLQQANAIESISHVDILCFDKTGTLTTNRLTYHAMAPLAVPERALADALGDYAAATTSPNRTIAAIAENFPGQRRPVREEVAFSSDRKWSAIAFADDDGAPYVLGAPEALLPSVAPGTELAATRDRWTAAGLRVLLLARAPGRAFLKPQAGAPQLPTGLVPWGLVSFRDELQPDAIRVVDRFGAAGVDLKIISGDAPDTVAALARQAGFGARRALRIVSGMELAGMSDTERTQAARHGEIFGRITPEQKLALVRDLQEQGRYVAMVGDGVNDVLALKQAQLGIAMEHGSQASRAVADMILLGNAFAALPAALQEGRRIVRGAQDLLKLFLARSLSMAVVILGVGVVGAAFPLLPTHNAVPALLALGIPTVALAAWARPGRAPGALLEAVLPFAVPAALSIGAVETLLYLGYLRATNDVELARTVLTTVAVLCGLVLILFVEPPTRAFTGGDELSSDWRVVGLVLAMLALLALVMAVPGTRAFLELALLAPRDLSIIGVAVAGWAVALRWLWRAQVMRRWLGLNPAP